MKISIVMAYYNRRALLIKTLESITNTTYIDFEMIIVDDASIDSQRINDLPDVFSTLNLKIIRVDKKDKSVNIIQTPSLMNNINLFHLINTLKYQQH